mmetsp:Transcript_55065/g.120781  ORF Transcript_55065/g.120781 Transcript_55065/m.120781 type:complete len:287 (+) Transcript_55065:204-1064(+)
MSSRRVVTLPLRSSSLVKSCSSDSASDRVSDRSLERSDLRCLMASRVAVLSSSCFSYAAASSSSCCFSCSISFSRLVWICFRSSTTLLALETRARLPRCWRSAGVGSMALMAFPSTVTASSSSFRLDSYRRWASSRSVSASEIRSCCSSCFACCASIAASISACRWRAPSKRFWMRPTAAERVSALRRLLLVLATHSSLSLTSCSSFCFRTFSISSILSWTSWKDTPEFTIARTLLTNWEREACSRKAPTAVARAFRDVMETCTKFEVAADRRPRASGLSSTLIAS